MLVNEFKLNLKQLNVASREVDTFYRGKTNWRENEKISSNIFTVNIEG